jgi:hypothetical protein
MNDSGWLYILNNPSMPGMVKIGRSQRDPKTRASELSSVTGVPTPFTLIYSDFYDDVKAAEMYVHAFFEIKGRRVASNREFFQVEIEDAIKCLLNTPGRCDPRETTGSDEEQSDSETSTLGEELYAQAWQHLIGLGDELEDHELALRLFAQSARLGFAKSYLALGDMYLKGRGVRQDSEIALNHYKEALGKGEGGAWLRMWKVYVSPESKKRHHENAEKALVRFFKHVENLPLSERPLELEMYLFYCGLLKLPPSSDLPYLECKKELVGNLADRVLGGNTEVRTCFMYSLTRLVNRDKEVLELLPSGLQQQFLDQRAQEKRLKSLKAGGTIDWARDLDIIDSNANFFLANIGVGDLVLAKGHTGNKKASVTAVVSKVRLAITNPIGGPGTPYEITKAAY